MRDLAVFLGAGIAGIGGMGDGDRQSCSISPLSSTLKRGYTFAISFRSVLRRALKCHVDSISGAKIRCNVARGMFTGFPSGIRGVR